MKISVMLAMFLTMGLNHASFIPSSNYNFTSLFLAQSDRRSVADEAIKNGEALIETNPRQAIQEFERARQLYRGLNIKWGEALALLRLGTAQDRLGEKQEALNALQNSLMVVETSDAKPSTKIRAEVQNALGSVYQSLGEYQQALDLYKQALELNQQLDEKASEVKTLIAIGAVYQTIGELQQALEYYRQAAIQVRNEQGLVENMLLEELLGDAILSFSILSKGYTGSNWKIPSGIERLALAQYTPVLQESRGVPQDESRILNKIGGAYSQLAEYSTALGFLERALNLVEAVNNPALSGSILLNLGQVYQNIEQYSQALNYYQRALPLLNETGNKTQIGQTYFNLAQLKKLNGNLIGAKADIELAIEIIEQLRSKIISQDLRTSYFATVQNYYQFYIDLLMELHKQNPERGFDAVALHASERSRARTLIELLTEAKANIRQNVDKDLLKKEQTLLQKFDATEKRRIELVRGDYKPEQLEKIKQELANLQTEYKQLQNQIKQKSPGYAAIKYPEPLNLQQIQQQVLDDDTILLEYSLGEERSYLWAVTKNNITSYELPPQAEIESASEKFTNLLTKLFYQKSSSHSQELSNAATALSEMILEPVASQLENQRLLIVSDGILQYVPFAALSVPGKNTLLLANSKIVNAPSASTIAINRNQTVKRQPAPKTIAIMADPVFTPDDERVTGIAKSNNSQETIVALRGQRMTRAARYGSGNWERLEGTRKEAEAIVTQVPDPQQRTYALDFEASKEKATNPELNEYKFVHFATHGFFNDTQPELSGIVMSLVDKNGDRQNGFLYLQDIFNLKLSAELVVLSACETGLGEEVKGEGIVGLTRGFMYAGSPRVVVSLWKVDDEATAELMTLFYQKMLVEKMKPVEALRAAQIEMLNSAEWQDPEYWAAFTLQGEWQ